MCPHFCGLDHLKKTLYLLNDYYWNTSCDDDGIFVMIQHIFMNFGKFNFTEKIIAKSAQHPAPTPPLPLSNNNNNVVEVS